MDDLEKQVGQYISIHALHEESDLAVFAQKIRYVKISIHALHEESDTLRHSARWSSADFNPRSP